MKKRLFRAFLHDLGLEQIYLKFHNQLLINVLQKKGFLGTVLAKDKSCKFISYSASSEDGLKRFIFPAKCRKKEPWLPFPRVSHCER